MAARNDFQPAGALNAWNLALAGRCRSEFLGGLAEELLRGEDLREAAITASAAAAASTLVPGDGRIDVAAAKYLR